MSDLSTSESYLQTYWERFRDWPGSTRVIRLAAGILLAIVFGPEIVEVTARYATYRYAIASDIRLPAEGVEFVAATAAGAARAVGIFSAVAYLLASATGSVLRRLAQALTRRNIFDDPRHQSVMLWILGSSAIGVIVLLAHDALGRPLADLLGIAITPLNTVQQIGGYGYVLLAAGVFIRLYRKVIDLIAIGIASLVFPISLVMLFDVQIYSWMLRELSYGGGINIEVVFNDSEAKRLHGSLMLRTETALLLRVPDTPTSTEVLLQSVRSIQYLP